jgi:hypothetical protein
LSWVENVGKVYQKSTDHYQIEENIVVSRNKDYAAKGAYVIHDLDKFLISTKICTGDGELLL